MGVTIKRTNNIPKLVDALKKLEKKEIQVGVFGHDSNVDHEDINMVTLARVHEFGMTITPKKGKFLTIPLIPVAKGKKASDFSDLFFVKGEHSNKNYGFLARKVGKRGRIQNVFLLLTSVTIPERSFLRTGFDDNVDNIVRKMEEQLQLVIDNKINPEVYARTIATEFAGMIQRHMKTVGPPKSNITLGVSPDKTKPLHDSGNLARSIKGKVK